MYHLGMAKRFINFAEALLVFMDEAPTVDRWHIYDVLINLAKYELQLQDYNERVCNRGLTSAEEANIAITQIAVTKDLKTLGFGVKFNADPRGNAIKLKLPSGKSNSWDGESWVVDW